MQGFSSNLQRRTSQWDVKKSEQTKYQSGEGSSQKKRKLSVEKSKKKRKSVKKRRVEFHHEY